MYKTIRLIARASNGHCMKAGQLLYSFYIILHKRN